MCESIIFMLEENIFRLNNSPCQEWATRAFRISASGVADETQIHTHMCYSEFNDILPEIAAMDADVIAIETSRSGMALLRGFGDFKYPNEMGPGVYDIHSPRAPSVDERVRLLRRAAAAGQYGAGRAGSAWGNWRPEDGLNEVQGRRPWLSAVGNRHWFAIVLGAAGV
nr:hypothetical protein [Polaromonas sp. SP1]